MNLNPMKTTLLKELSLALDIVHLASKQLCGTDINLTKRDRRKRTVFPNFTTDHSTKYGQIYNNSQLHRM